VPSGIEITLIALVTAAAWSDLRTRRIPNWITIPGAALGFALQACYGGLHGVLLSLAGAGLGLGIFVAFYIAGGMGAGDVKLFSAVGALLGPQALILVFVFTGLLGGLAAATLAASRGRLRETLEQTGELLLGSGRLHRPEGREAVAAVGPDALRLPYGVVIAGGTLVSLVILH
jgi:prepilin peptidase CpaA